MGNLFGSNIFNIFILAIDDFFFIKGPILSFVNQNHIVSALFAIAMTSTAIIGLTYRAEKRTLFLALDSIVIILLYMANIFPSMQNDICEAMLSYFQLYIDLCY